MSNDACIPPSLALNHLTTATKVVANFYIKLTQYDDEMPKRSGTNPVWCDGKSTYGLQTPLIPTSSPRFPIRFRVFSPSPR